MTTWTQTFPITGPDRIEFDVNGTHEFAVTARETRDATDYRALIVSRLLGPTWLGMPVHDDFNPCPTKETQND